MHNIYINIICINIYVCIYTYVQLFKKNISFFQQHKCVHSCCSIHWNDFNAMKKYKVQSQNISLDVFVIQNLLFHIKLVKYIFKKWLKMLTYNLNLDPH